jgi:oligopeptidase B
MINTRKLFIKRNITKKSYTYFKNNIHKYLTPEELTKMKCRNDLEKYEYKYSKAKKVIKNVHMNKKRINHFIQQIRKHYIKINELKADDIIWHNIEKQDDYSKYYIYHKCKKLYILDIGHLAKHFPYFNITEYQINPSNSHILFGVDFIGSRVYHLFIKSMYSNEIKEIKIPCQPLSSMKNIFGDTNITDTFVWLNDDEICYVSQNKYYNESAIYVYNINNETKYLLKKIPHGWFASIYVTSDFHYLVLYISDYSSDEVYIIDNEDRLKINKPIIPHTLDVSYPFFDHIDGEWIIYERNKTNDYLKRTRDFKTFSIDYHNSNPTETINDIVYTENTYVFTLTHLKGIQLISLKCGAIKIHYDEPRGHISIDDTFTKLKDVAYDIKYYLTKPTHHKLNEIPQTKHNYYEEKIYIKKDLYFTVLSKHKPHASKCLLIGYGSYNISEFSQYSPHFIALIEEGYTIVMSHLRGGGEYGFKGYNDGRLFNKKNTFLDFIEIADYIVNTNITTRKKLAIWGRSAGGLLISTVINMRPDLCELAILGVPFINMLSTLSTYKTPLGMESRSEFGNITNDKMADYIKSYSPMDNIQYDLLYPNIFIYANMYDTLVPYKESIEYYNKMTECDVFKHKKRNISLFIDNKFGHTQGSSATSKIESYSIIFDQLFSYIN